jgi:hypothetical protein
MGHVPLSSADVEVCQDMQEMNGVSRCHQWISVAVSVPWLYIYRSSEVNWSLNPEFLKVPYTKTP